jgi:hypothetical protein
MIVSKVRGSKEQYIRESRYPRMETMRRRYGGSAQVLLVVSIVGAILGMELDVISGPIAPDSLSLVLCDLEALSPAPVGRCDRPGTWMLIPAQSTSATSTPINADDLSETSPQIFDAVWPAPLSASPNRQSHSSSWRIFRHANRDELFSSPSSLRAPRLALTATAARLPLQLCRLLF